MITSMPESRILRPSTSGIRAGLPPGLSVMETAAIRPSSTALAARVRVLKTEPYLISAPGTNSRVITKEPGLFSSSRKREEGPIRVCIIKPKTQIALYKGG